MREWSDFYRFGDVTNEYMPAMGEGDTIASQASTAINKLVYKWFNDGDVFDNTHAMQGWCNDLSTYANWLAYHIEGAAEVLDGIANCYSDEDYTELLYDLCEQCCDDGSMRLWDTMPKEDSIYTKDGDYTFTEHYDDEEEELW